LTIPSKLWRCIIWANWWTGHCLRPRRQTRVWPTLLNLWSHPLSVMSSSRKNNKSSPVSSIMCYCGDGYSAFKTWTNQEVSHIAKYSRREMSFPRNEGRETHCLLQVECPREPRFDFILLVQLLFEQELIGCTKFFWLLLWPKTQSWLQNDQFLWEPQVLEEANQNLLL
jgi:hypothetical protein